MSGLISIKRREPHLGPNPDYSKAFYCDPPSHDFCVWLVIAELMRRYHGAPAPLKVRFGLIDGRLGVFDWGAKAVLSGEAWPCGVDRAYYETMLPNILRPAMEMIGAVEEPALHAPFPLAEIKDYCEWDYHIGHLVDAGRQGYEIPKWQVPQWAHDEVKAYLSESRPVIITLREAPAQPERNSRMVEWLRFAESIRGDHNVIFVRDTAKAHEALPFVQLQPSNFAESRTYPRASENVYVRAALYQRALVNMMVCNGPNTWCIFSDAPYLIFKQLVPALPDWAHGQPSGWRDQDHMEVGDQYPWASPLQRMTWVDDTFENIAAEFAAFLDAARDAGYSSNRAVVTVHKPSSSMR